MPVTNPNRKYILMDANDPRAFDERGILRDGYRIRVPLEMMDSAQRRFATPAPAPTVITTGLPLRGPGSLAREFYMDGTRKPRRQPRDEYGQPDEDFEEDSAARRRRRTQARDPMGREAGTLEEEDRAMFADNRPGFRQATAADRQRVDDAYLQMCRELCDAWKSPEQRAAESARPMVDACPPDVDPRMQAYNEMCRDLQDAWKPKEDAALTPSLPPYGWPKWLKQEGESCEINGRRGVWAEADDGFLYCRPLPLGAPATVPAENRNTDAMPPRTMSAADAQAIKDRAYFEMVSELQNAWKSQGRPDYRGSLPRCQSDAEIAKLGRDAGLGAG